MYDHNDITKRINGALDAAVRDWFRRQAADVTARHYFYYKPNHIAFWIGPAPLNDDWQLVTGERVSPMYGVDTTYNRLRKYCGSLPILPAE